MFHNLRKHFSKQRHSKLESVEQLRSRADSLAEKFKQGGEKSQIDEAILLDRRALELCPPGDSMRFTSLSHLSNHLNDRYNHFGEVVDIEENIVLNRDALALCLPGDPDRLPALKNLASSLSDRYKKLGAPEDLNEAIVHCRDALISCPQEHPKQSTLLNDLARFLSRRYKQLALPEDLDEAIDLGRGALVLCPPGHSSRSRRLDNLGADLYYRYLRLGEPEDLDQAIYLARDALTEALHSPRHLDRFFNSNNLANYLSERYEQLGAPEDLNEAIALAQDALVLCPKGFPTRSRCLRTLADCLRVRYEQFGEIEDINEAILLSRDGLALCPPGHIDRSRSLGNLASLLRTRFTDLDQMRDKEELFSLYAETMLVSPATSSADLSTAREWVHVAEMFRHPTTLLAYETSLLLLTHHLSTLPSLPRHLDVMKSLTSSLAMDAFSACLRNRFPTKAVELLEQGRGVFLSQLTRLRSPLDDVIASGPAGEILADEFTKLTSLIRNALDSPGVDQHDRVCRLNAELGKVVANIRELPGLSRFLLPSLFSNLQKAASGGPVIIVNASKYGCDALIVLFDRDPIHIQLHITKDRVRDMSSELYVLTKRAKLENVGKHFAVILRELWQKIVSPIVDCLQTLYPPQSRIWWCPTAEFCLLPLHAAGSYRTGEQKLTDLYISSYTPTLTALIRARGDEPTDCGSGGKHFVGIGQAKAVGESELHSVGEELANIGQRVQSLATFRSIEGSDSSINRVTEELDKNEWVHFACHGLPNRKRPFESAFALYDGHFTVERIVRCELPNAQFAYLSACHTTVGDEECPDEMIHLASAMQFAGFRSVIGTMWTVDDDQTKKITSMFYDNMVDAAGRLDHTRAALALHKTMQTLVGVSFDQRILYIHLGA